jgi:hypothetical protein
MHFTMSQRNRLAAQLTHAAQLEERCVRQHRGCDMPRRYACTVLVHDTGLAVSSRTGHRAVLLVFMIRRAGARIHSAAGALAASVGCESHNHYKPSFKLSARQHLPRTAVNGVTPFTTLPQHCCQHWGRVVETTSKLIHMQPLPQRMQSTQHVTALDHHLLLLGLPSQCLASCTRPCGT